MSGYGLVSRVSERVYQALLAAYPKEFRREYGSHMVQVFRDLCREEQRREDTVGLVRLWLRAVLDLVITALLERSSGRASDREAVVKDYKLAGIGFVLLLAPLFFVSASLLKYGAGIGLLFLPLKFSYPSHRDETSLTWSHLLYSLVGWPWRWHPTRMPSCG